MSENDKNKYRNKWSENLVILQNSMKDKSILNENFYIDLLNDYVILTELANKEIDLDESEKNKCLAKANMGLDCASLFLNSLLQSALQHSNQQKVLGLMESFKKNIGNMNESMLSESYKNRKNDNGLESFLL